MACTNTNATVHILLVTLVPSFPLVSSTCTCVYKMLETLGYEGALLSFTLSRLSLDSSGDQVIGEVARSAHLASGDMRRQRGTRVKFHRGTGRG